MKHQNDIKDTYNVKAATVLGFAHIICGVISGFCGINEIDVVVHQYSVSTIGAGVWSSMFFSISGGLAIEGAQSGKKGLVVATMVMAIILQSVPASFSLRQLYQLATNCLLSTTTKTSTTITIRRRKH